MRPDGCCVDVADWPETCWTLAYRGGACCVSCEEATLAAENKLLNKSASHGERVLVPRRPVTCATQIPPDDGWLRRIAHSLRYADKVTSYARSSSPNRPRSPSRILHGAFLCAVLFLACYVIARCRVLTSGACVAYLPSFAISPGGNVTGGRCRV